MAIVAASGLLFASCHGSGPRPGVYLAGLGYSCGACRNDSYPPWMANDGRPGACLYQAGLWRSAGMGDLLAGMEVRGSRVTVRGGGSYWVAW